MNKIEQEQLKQKYPDCILPCYSCKGTGKQKTGNRPCRHCHGTGTTVSDLAIISKAILRR